MNITTHTRNNYFHTNNLQEQVYVQNVIYMYNSQNALDYNSFQYEIFQMYGLILKMYIHLIILWFHNCFLVISDTTNPILKFISLLKGIISLSAKEYFLLW